MIHFEGVSKTFRAGPFSGRDAPVVRALHDVSVRIPPGEAWAVVGPNGAGKTTFFALLLGFLHPDAGTIEIWGEDPRSYVRRAGAAYLPERFRLPAEWSVRATLDALAGLEGLRGRAARERVQRVVEDFGLEPHSAKAVGTLSHGLMQRLGLAQALLGERALVVLDEPTEGLDPLWRIRFRAVVEQLRRDGRTVLVASHDLPEVERLTDRALLLERGEIRGVLDVGARSGETAYRLELATELPGLADIFPGASPVESRAGNGHVYSVSAADPAELSGRLAAVLEAGGILLSVAPAGGALEERVRRALEESP